MALVVSIAMKGDGWGEREGGGCCPVSGFRGLGRRQQNVPPGLGARELGFLVGALGP